MTDKEHAALEWLEKTETPAPHNGGYSRTEDRTHRATIKAMLGRLPSPTDHAAIDALAARAPTIPRQWIAEIIRIMHEPPAPPMKEVEVEQWAVLDGEHLAVTFHSESVARKWATPACGKYTVVRLTGKAMVPVIEVAPAADGCRGRTLAERRA